MLFLLPLLLVMGVLVLYIAAFWQIFTKANKPGWACLIPVYNVIVFLEIAQKPWWWIFLFFIPLVNIIIGIMVAHSLSLAFGKDAAFTVGLVLLGFIFYPILGFGNARYQNGNNTNAISGILDSDLS